MNGVFEAGSEAAQRSGYGSKNRRGAAKRGDTAQRVGDPRTTPHFWIDLQVGFGTNPLVAGHANNASGKLINSK
jgi:hypothetical protein